MLAEYFQDETFVFGGWNCPYITQDTLRKHNGAPVFISLNQLTHTSQNSRAHKAFSFFWQKPRVFISNFSLWKVKTGILSRLGNTSKHPPICEHNLSLECVVSFARHSAHLQLKAHYLGNKSTFLPASINASLIVCRVGLLTVTGRVFPGKPTSLLMLQVITQNNNNLGTAAEHFKQSRAFQSREQWWKHGTLHGKPWCWVRA